MESAENSRKNVVLRSQAREVAANVYNFMKHEAENGVERLTDARWRTARAVGVSERTISRIIKEKKTCDTTGTRMRSPHRHKNPRKRIKRDIDGFDKGVIRRTITTFHKQYKQFPSLKALKMSLNESINFDGSPETLRRILLDIGYEWKTTDDNRRVLVEKHDVQMLRYKYLKQLMKYRAEGRNIVFTDESYIQIPKGFRVMIVHAGGKNGFVPNASLIYKANATSADYHTKTQENYKKWFTTQLLPNIPEQSVIVMDNAAYHTFTEKVPSCHSGKAVMQEWLKSKNINFDENMKKIELYDTILKNKDKFRNYAIDGEAKKFNFDILRLPPCHQDLNPIEKFCCELKNYVANKTVDPDYSSVIKLVNEQIAMIDPTIWNDTCRYVEETEMMYWKCYEDEKEFAIHVGEAESGSDASSDDN